ncbi:hypothetical protein U0129_20975 [Enterobacter hormaechei]|uniref:hypothetical protein n=1 Tax=Enterobacter hormaechei TaxID=158836 RepID=UPI0039C14693
MSILTPAVNNTPYQMTNTLQPSYRLSGDAYARISRVLQAETEQRIINELANTVSAQKNLSYYLVINEQLRIAQADDGTVRYGVHLCFENPGKVNVVRIYQEPDEDKYDIYFFTVNETVVDLIDAKLNIPGMLLKHYFEKHTGLLLSC